MKVLLATDSTRLNELFSVRLVAEGIEPYKTQDDEELFLILEEKGIELLILDFDSDNFRGFSTIKEIKTKFNQVDIILLTTQTGIEFARRLAELGVYGFVSRADQLENMVVQTLNLVEEMRGHKQEKRQHMRVQPAQFQTNVFKLIIPLVNTIGNGIVRDISLGGVAVEMEHEMSEAVVFPGKEVEMEIEVGSMQLLVGGVVVARKGKTIALRFRDLREGSRRRICEYVISRMD